MSDTRTIRPTVNGKARKLSVPVRKLLSDVIREDLRLTGTHVGCEHGVCGACTVLLDGRPVRSCLMFAVQADGHELATIESMGSGEWEKHGLQCGFCTPAMVLTAKALLEDNPDPTEEEIRRGLSGNICRCTGYVFIVDAVRDAAERLTQMKASDA